jgi:hypothetical protein
MLYIILATLMPYQTIKLDKASFNLLAPSKALIIKDKEPVVVEEKYINQSYILRRANKPTSC